MKTIHRWTSIAAAVLLLFATGCDSLNDDAGTGADASMSVVLTDAPFPFDLVQEANVTISSISAETATEGRVLLSDEDHAFNLLELADGVTAELADDVDVPAGTYQRILLDVTDASVLLVNGERFDVTVPSGTIQVLVGNVTLDEGESASILLDFDVSQSFVAKGNISTPAGINGFNFKPVVRSKGYVTDDDDDDDDGAEIQGTVVESGADFVVVGETSYAIDANTEFDGGTAASLTPGTVVEVSFIQAPDGTFLATEIEIEDEDGRDVHETSGVVTAVDEVDGETFVTVGELQFRVVPGETEFEGVAGVNALVVDVTHVEIDYMVDDEGAFVALEIEVDDDDFDDDDDD